MWQRIQSVFLVLAILTIVASIFFPIWIGIDEGSGAEYALYPIHLMVKENDITTSTYIPYCLTAVLMAAAATISLMEIRRYDNRILQIKLGTLNSLVLAGVMICAVVFANMIGKSYPVSWKYDYSLYLTFASVTFNWLAIRFIRRDEKLVRDSGRLR